MRLVCTWTAVHQAPLSMGLSRQEYWSGSHSLLQGIFPTQGSNPCLLHWQADSLSLSCQGSPSFGTDPAKIQGRQDLEGKRAVFAIAKYYC